MMSPIVEKETKALSETKVNAFLTALCQNKTLLEGVLLFLRSLMVRSKKPYAVKEIVTFAMMYFTPGVYYNSKENRSLVNKVDRCLKRLVKNKMALNTTDLVYDANSDKYYTSSKTKIHRLLNLLTDDEQKAALEALTDLQSEDAARPFMAATRKRST